MSSAVVRHTWWVIVVDVLRRAGEGERGRVVQVTVDQHGHIAVERCREQQSLAVGRRLVEQRLTTGQEAEVGHVVGLVEDDDLDAAEVRRRAGR